MPHLAAPRRIQTSPALSSPQTDVGGNFSIRWNPPPLAARLLQALPVPAWFETATIEAGTEGQEDFRDGEIELIPREVEPAG